MARRLVALGDEIAHGRRGGATVFVSGDESDGREALLRAVAAEFGSTDSIVLAGRFERDRFEPWVEEKQEERHAKALQLLETVLPLAATLHPVLELFSLILAQSRKAWQIVSRISEQRGQIDSGSCCPDPQLAAQERPVVWLVDWRPGCAGRLVGGPADAVRERDRRTDSGAPGRRLRGRARRRRGAARAVRRPDARPARAGAVVAARADRLRRRRGLARERRAAGGRGAVRGQRRAQRAGRATVGGVAGRRRRRA